MKKYLSTIIISFSILALAVSLVLKNSSTVVAGVPIANEYQATTTSPTSPAAINTVLQTGSSVLGSVIITGSGSGFIIYDATTTDINLRASSKSTTTLRVLASFGNLPTVGTYTFDEVVFDGILIDRAAGSTIGTTTFTHR